MNIKKNTKETGQVLLIIVLLASVLVTVGLSLSKLSTDEQKVSKLEEESKKAFAAAEAGLEAALKQGDIANLSSLNLGSGITGSALVQTAQATSFTTPPIRKDEQFTFYMSTYDPTQEKVTGSAYSGDMTINLISPSPATYCNSASTRFALEISFIKISTKAITARQLIDECSPATIVGGTGKITFGSLIKTSTFPSHLMLVRVIADSSSFPAATLSIVSSNANWPLQGKTIVSEAKTTAGASRKLQLFQSYPQIPSDFWVTSF
jgi:Tfp pilus assembly protein PilX